MNKMASQGIQGPMIVRKTDFGNQGVVSNGFLVKPLP